MPKTIEQAFGLDQNKTIDKLNVTEIFNGINQLEQQRYCDASGTNISLFIGATRCGKSTTMNLLLSNSLEVIKDNDPKVPLINRKIMLVNNSNDDKYPTIGNKTTSETTIPTKYDMLENGTIWDCPGFGDSRGAQQEIINAWFVNRLFKTASGVKLFNLCSKEAILADNPKEFVGYIKQINDIFGEENLSTLQQILIFTKTSSDNSVDELKEGFMYLIDEHFSSHKNYEKLKGFFNRAKVLKIDKPETKDIGSIWDKSKVIEIMEAYNDIEYQKVEPHIGVDETAKVFLYKSVTDLCKVTTKSITEAYKKAYKEGSLSTEIKQKFKSECTDTDLDKLSEQFEIVQKKIISTIESDLTIKEQKAILKEIVKFILEIIPDNQTLEQLINTNISAIDYYNTKVLNYCITTDYLKFLKNNSHKLTAKEAFHTAWQAQIDELDKGKPQFANLESNLENLNKASTDIMINIQELNKRQEYAAGKEQTEKYQLQLAAAQHQYMVDMHSYQAKLIEASKPSGWTWIPVVGHIIAAIINLIYPSEKFTLPNFKPIILETICKVLDKSFDDSELPTLGTIEDFFVDPSLNQ